MQANNLRFRRSVDKTVKMDVLSPSTFDIDDDAIEVFKEAYMYDDWSERTLEFHLENLSVFRNYLSKKGINSITPTPKILEDYIGELRKTGKMLNTINGRIKTLRVFFRVLHEKGYITNNPADSIRTIKGPKPEILPFTPEQVKALLAVPDKNTFTGLRDSMIMLILLDTGIRLEELVNVKLSDLNLKKRNIFIIGKGRKRRTVYFGGETRKMISKYLAFTGIEDDEYNLILNQDGQPLRPRTIQERISDYAKTANITGVRCSPHTFRHTFAKMFLMSDGDPYVLRDLLGHSCMSTVIIYLKLFREDLQKKYRGKSPVDKLTRFRRNQI